MLDLERALRSSWERSPPNAAVPPDPAEPEQAGVQEGAQGLDFEDKELLADTISALRAAGIATDEKQL